MNKLYIPIILLIGMVNNINAQEKSRKESKGDKYAFNYSHDKAIDSYTHAKNLTTEGQRKLAESYHLLNMTKEAEIAYAKLVNSSSGVISEDYFNYAMALKSSEKYDEAHKWLDKFATEKPSDLRAKDYIAHKSEFAGIHNDDGKYKITNLEFNTEAEDFGTSYYKNGVVFSSSRAVPKMIKRKYNWNGQPFLNMYISEIDGDQLKKPERFDKNLDSKMHDGPASFSNNGTFMAFTQNHSKDKSKDKVVELQIYFSSYKNDKWSKPEPFIFNNDGYSAGHPCLTADGNTMYFTSDMAGGYGGTDIYKTTRTEKGEWTKPENLGDKINTEGDEMFPFYEDKSGAFFFASNGRFGLGGLDVFITSMNDKKVGKVYNAGAPLNTNADDFAIISDNKLNKGYFSSNRIGGSGADDIYSIEFTKGLNISKKIQGMAKDKAAICIPHTLISLYDDKGKIIDTMTTKADGIFTFLVESDKNFKLIGQKTKYIDGDTTANTFGDDLVVNADITLLTKEEIVTKAIEQKSDLGILLKLNSIYFDLDKYNIRLDAQTELDKIVMIMNEYPNMIVELGAHTDCRESKEYNQILSDRRAGASIDYVKKRITKPSRITGKGYGKTKLINNCSCDGDVFSDCSEDEHQKNRRTEFIIIKK